METAPTLAEKLLPYVRQVMQVEVVTAGGPQTGFQAQFGGRLVIDSKDAYDRLKEPFAREGARVMLRLGPPAHLILAVVMPPPRPSNPLINAILFLATSVTVLMAGVANAAGYRVSDLGPGAPPTIDLSRDLPLGIVFAVSLLSILLAHEFGHYVAARIHGTSVSLPYFIPAPSVLGTLGAAILFKEPPRDRRTLLDIGLSGPVAGLVVALPILLVGLSLSQVARLPMSGAGMEGNSVLYLLIKLIIKGQLLPEPVSYGGVPPFLYWVRYVLTGLPAPAGGLDVLLHPMAWAGWIGLLVTAFNLLPAGQLDGGHLIYVLIGNAADRILPFLIFGLVGLGFLWSGWWLWALLLFFVGRGHSQPLDQITPLDARRKLAAILGLVLLVLIFMPVPFSGF
ncbi:MAG: site-2 protease family protein [Anaerolineales bacterium]